MFKACLPNKLAAFSGFFLLGPKVRGGGRDKGKNAFVHLIDLIPHKLPFSSSKI